MCPYEVLLTTTGSDGRVCTSLLQTVNPPAAERCSAAPMEYSYGKAFGSTVLLLLVSAVSAVWALWALWEGLLGNHHLWRLHEYCSVWAAVLTSTSHHQHIIVLGNAALDGWGVHERKSNITTISQVI